MLKSKEKLLFTKERKLKEMVKKLHMTEISTSDQLDQNEYSKTYILTMEHKLKELESTNRLLVRVFRRTWTDAKELLKEKSFFILSFVFLSEFVIRQVQTNIY